MRTTLAALVALVALAGCNPKGNRETGAVSDRDRSGVDTAISSTKVKDTTVVKADTNIDVDTTKKTEHGKDAKH
jgi:hypothetical protein